MDAPRPLTWTASERPESVPAPRQVAFAHWVAGFMCILYGFAKINGAQFTVLDSELARPMGEVSGFWLTWYYFGFSEVYGTMLACFQIIGGALLLIPRTRLVAALMLLPMALNIVAVDLFFGVDLSGTASAFVLTICLVLVVLPHARRLWEAVVPKTAEHARGRYVIIPLALAAAYGATYWVANVNNRAPTSIDGVWQIQAISDTIPASDAITPALAFFERNRAHMVVIRTPTGSDDRHHFEMDSTGTIRIWQTWSKRDSLMYVGTLDAEGRILLRDGVTSQPMLALTRTMRTRNVAAH